MADTVLVESTYGTAAILRTTMHELRRLRSAWPVAGCGGGTGVSSRGPRSRHCPFLHATLHLGEHRLKHEVHNTTRCIPLTNTRHVVILTAPWLQHKHQHDHLFEHHLANTDGRDQASIRPRRSRKWLRHACATMVTSVDDGARSTAPPGLASRHGPMVIPRLGTASGMVIEDGRVPHHLWPTTRANTAT